MTTKKMMIHVCGWTGCPFYQKASKLASSLSLLYPSKYGSELHETPTRDEYREELFTNYRRQVSEESAQSHTACPFVYVCEEGQNTYVGGCDATVDWARGLLSPASSDSSGAATMLPDGYASDHPYDYDVVVIGGGSGGLACSKELKRLGASKVAVLDYVKPSPKGTTWGIGGTCVNVGCIPKKLMHTASIIGETIEKDAEAFGWEQSQSHKHDWEKMRENVQNHIKSLNFAYRVNLREVGVDYLNRLGTFVDDHHLELADGKGTKSKISAARFVVAAGGRPTRLQCPGAEHAIDSDDLFSLSKPPGRTLCVGGGYVSLECAGFLAGLGYPATCMVRSVLLRGFDRECVDKIETYMVDHGVKMNVGVTPSKIEKVGDVLKVTDSSGKCEEYDTVLVAVGREADTKSLGLDTVPISPHPKSGKLVCSNEQIPQAPHVYAIGDVVHGRPELTPVAIEAGLRLARRLYGGINDPMDYENVATTVFTPLEYGCIGMTEEEATEKIENLQVYISQFSPLEYALSSESRHGNPCFAKLLVDETDGKVVGFHYLGPNAGEITQGFSVAMRKGATYNDFVSTVGIHPTVAEEFTTLTVTKASGESADKGGC